MWECDGEPLLGLWLMVPVHCSLGRLMSVCYSLSQLIVPVCHSVRSLMLPVYYSLSWLIVPVHCSLERLMVPVCQSLSRLAGVPNTELITLTVHAAHDWYIQS